MDCQVDLGFFWAALPGWLGLGCAALAQVGGRRRTVASLPVRAGHLYLASHIASKVQGQALAQPTSLHEGCRSATRARYSIPPLTVRLPVLRAQAAAARARPAVAALPGGRSDFEERDDEMDRFDRPAFDSSDLPAEQRVHAPPPPPHTSPHPTHTTPHPCTAAAPAASACPQRPWLRSHARSAQRSLPDPA